MILGVIPARGGSKTIPRKNIKLLLGKPLIVWSIEAARESLLLDHFIVSTEDAEIAGISEAAGADVLVRPESLASDNATGVAVLQHVLKEIPADIIVLLLPTSPIRSDNIIDRAIDYFFAQKCDTLATGYISKHFAWGKLDGGPRQNLEGYFHDDGNIYIFKSQVLKASKWFGDCPCRMEIPHVYNLEIDTIADFWAIEGILRHVIDGDHKDWI
jgi:CMP-N-acetylneuraminic acid synthetase